QGDRESVLRLLSGTFGVVQQVFATDQVPCEELPRGTIEDEVVAWVPAGEQFLGRIGCRFQKPLEVMVHPVGSVGLIDIDLVKAAEGVMQGNIEGGAAGEGGKPRHRLG